MDLTAEAFYESTEGIREQIKESADLIAKAMIVSTLKSNEVYAKMSPGNFLLEANHCLSLAKQMD